MNDFFDYLGLILGGMMIGCFILAFFYYVIIGAIGAVNGIADGICYLFSCC